MKVTRKVSATIELDDEDMPDIFAILNYAEKGVYVTKESAFGSSDNNKHFNDIANLIERLRDELPG